MRNPTYQAASRELLSQANQELARGDIRQASEKGWGAAAQIVKAVAESRGWQHDSHALLYETVGRLVEETGDRQIANLFRSASHLHINFYENWYPALLVTTGLDDVELLLGKLEPLV